MPRSAGPKPLEWARAARDAFDASIDFIANEGLEPTGGTPEEFLTLIKREIAEWAEVIKQAKITIN